MSNKRISHDLVKKTLLTDTNVKAAYDNLAEEYQLLAEMLNARKKAGISQTTVAKSMHTTTSAISRLESFHLQDRPSPSFATLKKYAHVLGCSLSIKLIPQGK